jgi:hypothetical protein
VYFCGCTTQASTISHRAAALADHAAGGADGEGVDAEAPLQAALAVRHVRHLVQRHDTLPCTKGNRNANPVRSVFPIHFLVRRHNPRLWGKQKDFLRLWGKQ